MKRNIFISLILGVFFVACAVQTQNLSHNSKYRILSISLNEILLESPQDASFNIDNNKIYGSTGCNNYFVDFKWIDKNIIEISDNGGATKMMCHPEANEFEMIFLKHLVGKFNVTSLDKADEVALDNGSFTIILGK